MRLSFAAVLAGLAACRPTPDLARAEPADAASPMPPIPDASVADAAAPDAATPAQLNLELRKKKSDVGECIIVDKATNMTIGHATAQDTAAGGSDVECTGIAADGKVILFENSRGRYAKDARPGTTNDRSIPCAHGVFASDLSSCVELDFSPFAMGDEDAPFEVQYCKPLAAEWKCTPLVSIPHGMKRNGDKAPTFEPRWWDARYCADDRLLVLANDVMRLYETPSGRMVSSLAAPRQTTIASCNAEKAETTDGKNERHTFRIAHDTMTE